MNIWNKCQGIKFCKTLDLNPWRIVEAQHVLSSRDLVESREEHELLESLLEKSKPKCTSFKHYLINTSFRYPPLKYGSRFGYSFEPSLWYGSINLETAFAEVAYYRLKFFNDTEADLGFIELLMTAFKAYIKTAQGIDLTEQPFKTYQDKISNKISYEHSQVLGSEMRKANIEVFIFTSARDLKGGKNVAVFTPEVFKQKNKQYITNMQNWRCIANKKVIEFSRDEVLHRSHQEFVMAQFQC
jgi:hypothetical protein